MEKVMLGMNAIVRVALSRERTGRLMTPWLAS
jgi:hypothetical protein